MKLTDKEHASQNKLANEKPLAWAKAARFDEQLAAGKAIPIIQLQYSYLCNFHCSHCSILTFRNQSASRALTVPVVKRVFDEADAYGVAHVAISGGEPLAFHDLPELIEAIGPQRFHVQCDTNGWLMTAEKARWLKAAGVDKIQISLDSLDSIGHDAFRRKPGSYERAIRAIEHVKAAGLALQVATVVDHERAQSQEFEDFVVMVESLGAATSAVFAKPVGEWAGRYDLLCTPEDIRRVNAILAAHGGYTHTTPCYGRDLGCIAVKRMVAITAYGDVMPCPWIYLSLGNVFDTPLADILSKGMRYFGEYTPLCRMSEDGEFTSRYTDGLSGRNDLPAPIEGVMGER